MSFGQRYGFEELKGVRTSQKLTDRGLSSILAGGTWNSSCLLGTGWTIIRSRVLQYMGRVREQRLIRELQELSKRLEPFSNLLKQSGFEHVKGYQIAFTDWQPTLADLASEPGVFCDIINDIGSEGSVIEQNTLGLSQKYQEASSIWLKTRQTEMDAAVLQSLTLVSTGAVPHMLAIAMWDCILCGWSGLRWTQLLAHECGRQTWLPQGYHDVKYDRALLEAYSRLKLPRMWTILSFQFNPALDRTRAAIEACGEDPDKVTFVQMDACPVRLICSVCLNGKQSCNAFDWQAAVRS